MEAFAREQDEIDETKADEGTTRGAGEATPSSSNSTFHCEKINDHIFEVYKPAGRPSVELVFFHGLQLDASSSNYKEAHIKTWTLRDMSQCWLTWLLDYIPNARILTVSYDAAASTSSRDGRLDMYVTTENLVHDLTGDAAGVGQDGCPVVLVGHCLGGLIMKEVYCQAHQMIGLGNHPEAVKTFLDSIKGFFFFATPHHGSLLADSNQMSLNAPLIEDMRILKAETSRRNQVFLNLRKAKGWKTYDVRGSAPVTLNLFEGVVVQEASARSDMDFFYTDTVDHYNICRPVNKQTTTFQKLWQFARPFVTEWQQASNVPIDVPSSSPSPLGLSVLTTVNDLVPVLWFFSSLLILGFVLEKGTRDMYPDGSDWSGPKYLVAGFMLVLLNFVVLTCIVKACLFLLWFCMTGQLPSREQLEEELASAPACCDQILGMCIQGLGRGGTPPSYQEIDDSNLEVGAGSI